MDGDQLGPKRSALRISIGAGVVLLGLASVVVALGITLDHYPVQAAANNQPGLDRSAAVVAVLTPVVAGLAGIVGLYFGISATGSSRAQQAQTNAQVAKSATDAAQVAAQTTADVAKSAADAAQVAAQTTAQVAKSATEAAQTSADVAKSATEAAHASAQTTAQVVQSATEAANSATEAAKSAAQAAQSATAGAR